MMTPWEKKRLLADMLDEIRTASHFRCDDDGGLRRMLRGMPRVIHESQRLRADSLSSKLLNRAQDLRAEADQEELRWYRNSVPVPPPAPPIECQHEAREKPSPLPQGPADGL